MQQLETIFEQRPDVKEFMATHYSSQELPDGTSTDQCRDAWNGVWDDTAHSWGNVPLKKSERKILCLA